MGSNKTDQAAKVAKLVEVLPSISPKEDVAAAVEKRLEVRLNKLQTELTASISNLRKRVRGVQKQVGDFKASQVRVEFLDLESTLDLITNVMDKQSGEVRISSDSYSMSTAKQTDHTVHMDDHANGSVHGFPEQSELHHAASDQRAHVYAPTAAHVSAPTAAHVFMPTAAHSDEVQLSSHRHGVLTVKECMNSIEFYGNANKKADVLDATELIAFNA